MRLIIVHDAFWLQDKGNEYVFISRLGEGSYGSVLLCRKVPIKDEVSATGQDAGAEDSALVAVKKFKWAHNDNMVRILEYKNLKRPSTYLRLP